MGKDAEEMKVRKLFWERSGLEWEAHTITGIYKIRPYANELFHDEDLLARGPFHSLKQIANQHFEEAIMRWFVPDDYEDDSETHDEFPPADPE